MGITTPNDIILRDARKMGYVGDADELLMTVADAMDSGEPYSDGAPYTEWLRELIGD
jgi:hypothetical protein